MSEQYGRFWSVVIQQYSYSGGVKVFNQNKEIRVNDLRTVFRCEKSWLPTPNVSQIDVYNLAPENRAFIEEKQAYLSLYAGYQSDFNLIFAGDVNSVNTKRDQGDIVTSMQCGDGSFYFGQKSMAKSFKPGTSVRQILTTMVDQFGLAIGLIKGENLDSQYANGFTHVGLVRDGFNTLMGKLGLEWSIQDGKIQVLPEKVPTDDAPIILNPATGLVNSPFSERVLRQDMARKQDGQLAETGSQMVALLNGSIYPGRKIIMQSEYVTGTFKVRSVIHEGDSHGVPWYSTVSGIGTYSSLAGAASQAFAAQGVA